MQPKITIQRDGKVTIEMLSGPASAACSLEVQRLLHRLQESGIALQVEHEESRPPSVLGGLDPLASATPFGTDVVGDVDATASATAL